MGKLGMWGALGLFWGSVAAAQGIGAAEHVAPWSGIREVGFPAAAFVLLWVMMGRQLADVADALRAVRETLAELRGWLEGRE